MHIGFDVSQTGSGKAGCGYFAHAMIKALLEISSGHNYSLFPTFGDFYFDAGMPKQSPYFGSNIVYGPSHCSREVSGKFWNDSNLEVSLRRPNIVHANNFWCPIQLRSSRLVYTFYDMSFAVDPSWTTEANRIGCFAGVFRSAMAADWVIAISEASKSYYLKMFPHFPKNRIRVVYPCSRFMDSSAEGVQPSSLKHITRSSYWLSVGTIEPRKNQYRLAEAYARYLTLGGRPMPLILAGGKGWLMDDFQKHLIQLGIVKNVVMAGSVSDDELIWLYRNCYANLYPSLFEGFGLPVLEGMQFGAPTLASDSTSIPEVTGDSAILLDPKDIYAWAETMLRLSINKSERGHLSIIAKEQADKFDWKRSASALFTLYEEALRLPKRDTY